jgi:hypothetical protein
MNVVVFAELSKLLMFGVFDEVFLSRQKKNVTSAQNFFPNSHYA